MRIELFDRNHVSLFVAGFVQRGQKNKEIVINKGERIVGFTGYRYDDYFTDLQFIIAKK